MTYLMSKKNDNISGLIIIILNWKYISCVVENGHIVIKGCAMDRHKKRAKLFTEKPLFQSKRRNYTKSLGESWLVRDELRPERNQSALIGVWLRTMSAGYKLCPT